MTMSGCVERTVTFAHSVKPVLATGAWFKSTLCITSGNHALISKSAGDLDTQEACLSHEKMARELLDRMDKRPVAIAHDLHPDFYSTRYAEQLAAELKVPLIPVQHHHAHIAALCAEHDVDEPVLGLALDGVGLGTDRTAWGGELLLVQDAAFQRLGNLRSLALPGGDRAAQEPWRMAASVLHELGRNDEITLRYVDEPGAETVATMLRRNLNCPRTSSMGRVFDAAAGLLGLCHKMEFEAQAAIALEQIATRYVTEHGMPPAANWKISADGQLDLLPLFALLSAPQETGRGAALFHATLIAALTDWVMQAVQRSGIKILACGGGCFFNRLLSAGLRERLEPAGIRLLTSSQPGDTAISLGQAWVALKTIQQGA